MSTSSLLLIDDIFDRKLDINKYSQIFIEDLKLILSNNYNETFLNSSLIGTIENEHIRHLIWNLYLNKEEFSNIKTIKDYFYKRKEKFENFEKKIDIIRTFPDKILFKEKYILNILTNTLVMWSLDNSKLSYRQGMNEICAIIIISLYPYYNIKEKYNFIDEKKLNELLENPEKNYKELYKYNYNNITFEFDIYELFFLLMKNGVKTLYETIESKDQDKYINPDAYKKYELFQFKVDNENEAETKTNKLIQRCDDIIKKKLKYIDGELYNHFVVIDLNCSIFLQKWLKCLFTREFKINEVILLWDCIIIFGNNLEFIDFITISILISMRKDLLKQNQDDCFQTIFNFDKNNQINILKFIGHSNELKDVFNNKISKKTNQTENKQSIFSNLFSSSTSNNNTSNNSRIFSSESSNSFKTPSSNLFSQNQNINNKLNQTNNQLNNQGKSYLSNAMSAMSSFGNFIKGFVNMEPQIMNKFNNNQKQDIAFSALDISNHTNNLDFILKKYKDKMSEEDIYRFEFSIKFFRTAGKSLPSSINENK